MPGVHCFLHHIQGGGLHKLPACSTTSCGSTSCYWQITSGFWASTISWWQQHQSKSFAAEKWWSQDFHMLLEKTFDLVSLGLCIGTLEQVQMFLSPSSWSLSGKHHSEKKSLTLLWKCAEARKFPSTLAHSSFSISSQTAAAGAIHGKWHHVASVHG